MAQLTIEHQCAKFAYDPLGFVYWAWPWGQPGTRLAPTAKDPIPGPDLWQTDILETLGTELLKRALDPDPDGNEPVMIAVASGHDIGKSTLIVWLIYWAMSCRRDPHIVLTANTKTQLNTTTWRELGIWHEMAVNADWFTRTATTFFAKWRPGTWQANAIPWTTQNSQAFAGKHDAFVMFLKDEASTIADVIWEVTEGALLSGECVWIVFGNPTENTGRFRECFRKFRARWITRQIDSRTCKIANKKTMARQIADYGEDSDFVRVRIKGMFPRLSVSQLISEDYVIAAQKRVPHGFESAPLIFGVDTARFGADQTVIYMRQGAATRNVIKRRGLDEVQIADEISKYADLYKPQAIFIGAGGGYGAGAYDLLVRRKYGDTVYAVPEGGSPRDAQRFGNKRIEMWWDLMVWLRDVGCIDERDQDLYNDLIGPSYHYGSADGKRADVLFLESKDDMKDRGLPSPDTGDAAALTFAYPVHPTSGAHAEKTRERRRRHRPWQAN